MSEYEFRGVTWKGVELAHVLLPQEMNADSHPQEPGWEGGIRVQREEDDSQKGREVEGKWREKHMQTPGKGQAGLG